MTRLPWFVWTSVAAVTCILAGTYWDISWHMSIGRDSFWTPAHLLIQAGGILAGVSGAVLILLRRSDATVRVWGFRGPLGAFVGAWGAATMVVSAPFDNWWHNAYGLDVKILSPPHMVLTLGILGVAAAGVLLVVRHRWALLVIGAEILTLSMIAIIEKTFRANLHRADAYVALAIVAPWMLLSIARASDHRWGATIAATFYTAFMATMVWLFPLFPAEPKLGPVYQSITHYVPLEFPILIVVPAIAIDLVRARLAWPRWRLALVLGPVFVATLVAVEWPFATFVQSPAARNAVFGSDYFAYFMRPEWFETNHQFMPDTALARGLAIAVVAATVSALIGMALGDAVRRVRR